MHLQHVGVCSMRLLCYFGRSGGFRPLKRVSIITAATEMRKAILASPTTPPIMTPTLCLDAWVTGNEGAEADEDGEADVMSGEVL